MAVKTYYGTCTTAAETSIKEVYVRDIDLTEEEFQFQRGDLLVVYFTHKNLNETPSLKILVGDTENEVSIHEDTGKLVKTHSVATDGIVGAWDDGETVIFVYTFNASGEDDNNYYWELSNGVPSTEEIYGVTKLFGNENINIKEWLQTPSDKDYTTALAPGLLKKFYTALQSDSGSMITLSWQETGTGNLLTLGTLTVNDDPNNTVQIKYPLETLIKNILEANLLATDKIANKGQGDNLDNNTADGKFYITNILPADKSLYYMSGNTKTLFIRPETTGGNLHLSGKNGITLNVPDGKGGYGGGRVTINPPLTVNGAIKANSTIDSKGITCTGLTLNGSGVASGNLEAKGSLKGKTLYEDGVALRSKYSGALKVVDKHVGPFTIGKSSSTGHKYLNIAESGWKAIGVVGWNLNEYVSGTGDGHHCYLWESIVMIGDQKLMYSIHNTKNATAKVTCNFRILYVKAV